MMGKMLLSKKKTIVATVAAVRPVVCMQRTAETITPIYATSSVHRGFKNRAMTSVARRRPTANREFPMDRNPVTVRGDLESAKESFVNQSGYRDI